MKEFKAEKRHTEKGHPYYPVGFNFKVMNGQENMQVRIFGHAWCKKIEVIVDSSDKTLSQALLKDFITLIDYFKDFFF